MASRPIASRRGVRRSAWSAPARRCRGLRPANSSWRTVRGGPSRIRCRPICRWAITTSIPRPAIGGRGSSSRLGGASNPASTVGLGRAASQHAVAAKLGHRRSGRSRSGWPSGRPNLGAGMMLINPLGAAAPVVPQGASPYYPTSRRFRNPLYLCMEEIPGAERLGPQLAQLAAEARALNAAAAARPRPRFRSSSSRPCGRSGRSRRRRQSRCR